MKQIRNIWNICTALLFCAVATDIYAQVERNYPHYYIDGDYWLQFYGLDRTENIDYILSLGLDPDLDILVAMYLIEGDTVIDNKEYKCVHEKILSHEEETHSITGMQELRNYFFIREDADGRQWRRFPCIDHDLLMWDFSEPFQEGGQIRYTSYPNLYDMHDYEYWKNLQDVFISERTVPITSVTTIELAGESDVPLANGRIAFGWGHISWGDCYNQEPFNGYYEPYFICRVHDGQIVFKSDKYVDYMNFILGTNVLTVFDEWTGIEEIEPSHSSLTTHSSNRQCYDLSGRQLSGPPMRGAYIENGKVMIK